jgi:phage terminase large subunit-like protein
MDILSAIDDHNLLGASIKDPVSFAPWKALLASAFGLSLDVDQLKLYRECTGRSCPPSSQFKSVFVCAGRRAGKSVCMALIATYLAIFRDWRPKLTAGERAVILLVAGDRDQAKILYRYIVGILNAPILNNLILNYTADSLDLKGCVTIEVVTRSYRAVRGRSVCAALLDEVAFFRSDDSANPDNEVVAAIRPSMATFGNDEAR